MLTPQNEGQQHEGMMLTVHLHRHDMSTVLLCCPVTNTRPALSYYYSNWTGDNEWRVHFGEINVFNSGLVICGLFNLWRNPWLFFHSSVCLRRIFSLFFKKIIQVKAKRQKMTMPFMRVIITFVLLGRNKLLRSSQTS